MRSFTRSLLVVLALAGGLREAGSAACQSLCPWGAFLDLGPTAVAAEPSCGGCSDRSAEGGCADADASDCALPCAPDAPCPLFAPSPPALVERPLVSVAHADPHHDTVGPVEVLPATASVAADVDPEDAGRLLAWQSGIFPARVARGMPLLI